jgi:hypothetical protein
VQTQFVQLSDREIEIQAISSHIAFGTSSKRSAFQLPQDSRAIPGELVQSVQTQNPTLFNE